MIGMQQRRLGRTGVMVSAIGFGCGAVGGLMVRGTRADQERAVARALEAGITYFDTAADYGNGVSEENLGAVLRALRANPIVGTKVRLPQSDYGRIGQTIAASMDASLKRLGRDSVHLFQLHNPIRAAADAACITPTMVEADVLPAFVRLREAGKAAHFGFTAIGDEESLGAVLGSGVMEAAQLPYNLLNGTPGGEQDRLLRHAAAHDVGVIGIRTFAGGALSGSEARGPLGTPIVQPIASGARYADDVAAAQRFRALVEAGQAADLIEAALRFAITTPHMGTAMVGLGSVAELEHAIAAANKGPLPAEALALIGY
jgi:L-galactose dehydrogenase/L-glyceraldehyde 3-phosphate reductase